jgi:alkylation response protein AidB-like acyl-CoA dehydrogenase
LTGEKTWVSGVPESEAAVVWTKFSDGTLGSVLMPYDADGVEISEHYTNMHGDTQTHFFMEDVYIPEQNVLVQGKEALHEQLKALNWERCGSSMWANSISLAAFDKAIEYAKERIQFDKPIAEFQGIQWKLADMAKLIEASRTLTYRAAINAQQQGGVPDRLETSIAKLFSSESVEKVVSEGLQIHGANGYQRGHPLEYLYRLQRGRRLAAGTDEIQKNQIASVILEEGLSRTP